MTNLLDDPAQRQIAERLHARLRRLLVESQDHYVLAPAFGQPGLNLWRPLAMNYVAKWMELARRRLLSAQPR